MRTSLLFIPFPHSNGSTNDPNAFNQLFQGEASQMMELSRVTKMNGCVPSSFRPYIRSLSTKRRSQLQSVWSDPFDSNNCVPSQSVEIEIIATIWNYIVSIHMKVLQENSSDVQCLKTMRGDFEEINACNAAFEQISSTIQHPFFTPQLAQFMKLYQSYITSYWQLSCISSTNKTNLIPAASVRCFEDIKSCENYCSQLNSSARNYLLPAIDSIRSYIEGYTHYRLSFISLDSRQYGLTFSHLKKGIEVIKSRNNYQNSPQAQSINSANQYILNALEENYNKLRGSFPNYANASDNPSFPRSCSPPVVAVASPLLCLPNEIIPTSQTQQPNMITSTFSNVPNFQNQIPNQSQNYQTYNQAAGVPYPYAPPKVNYPQIAPAVFPEQKSEKPVHQSPKKVSGAINIKEWEIVCALKKELLPRIQKAIASPKSSVSTVAKTLLAQYQAAADIDTNIQQSINNSRSDPSISPDSINPYIKQADVFYTQLEERLNILDRTGK